MATSPYQPRRTFSDAELQELADSIRSVGLIHPPLVRPLPNGDYELIAGERRLRAARLAGLKTIPVLIRSSGESQSADAALIENLQRVDLNAIELAEALQRLTNHFGYSQAELAQRIGKQRSTVANYLRLLSLPPEIQSAISRGQITMGHAKVILSLKEPTKQLALLEKIIGGRYSVRETEGALTTKAADPHLLDLQRQLETALACPVTLKHTKSGSGTLTLAYHTLDDLDRLLETLGVS